MNFLFALRNLQCGFRIAKFRIAKFENGFSHCQMVFRIAKWFFALPNGFSHCQMVFRIAKWIFALPNGFSHCEIRCGFSHCEISHCEIRNTLRTVCENSHCFALRFCFAHNFFIRTPFWAFLVPLESLESVESKYAQKEHF